MEVTNEMLSSCLVRIANGDVAALDEIHNAIGKLLVSVAFSITLNRMDAEDVVQDSYLKLVTKAIKYRVRKNPKAWLCISVRNLAIDRVRRRKRERTVPLTIPAAAPVDTPDEFIVWIFSRLDLKEEELIRMYFWYGMSLSEIASKFHVGKSTVAYRLNAVESKIRRLCRSNDLDLNNLLKDD